MPPIISEKRLRDIRDTALSRHDSGDSIVPCYLDNHPDEGKQKAAIWKEWPTLRRDREELEKALNNCQPYNIALVLNQSEWMDVEHDNREAGEAVLRELFEGEIPPTPTYKSPRGWHRFFRRPDGLPNKAKVEIDGIEFRGCGDKGALAIIPPSFGREWLPGLSLDDVEPAELPQHIIDRLRSKHPKPAEPSADGDDIPEGERNDSLFAMACKLRDAKLSADSVERSLLAENTARCNPPLPESEVKGIVQSAMKQESKPKQTCAEKLLAIAERECELWHTPDKVAFVTIQREAHREHWPIRSKGFRQYLAKRYHDEEKGVVGSQTLQDVINALEGKANFDGPEYPAAVRVVGYDKEIYLDLGNDNWQAVRISSEGWQVVDDPPVRFRRPSRMLPLPSPERGGSVLELRPFLNVRDEGWKLVVGFIVGLFRPRGPYPILKTLGEHGSAKTTLTRAIRGCVDPNTAPTRGAPHGERDLMIAAHNSFVCAFDNLSYLTPEISDALCRLTSGGGHGVRTHYENDEETVFHFQRPVILNGIEDIGVRSDLLDRALVVETPPIEDKDRLSESEFDARFEEARPRILGALLDAVSVALRNLPAVQKRIDLVWPRMADFAQFVVAAEPALGLESGEFLQAYAANRQFARQAVLDSSPIVPALRAMLKRLGGKFKGTATELLDQLSIGQGPDVTKAKGWPKTARPLSGILTRLAPDLRRDGFEINQDRHGDDKVWELAWTKATDESASTQRTQSTQVSEHRPKTEFTKHVESLLAAKGVR